MSDTNETRAVENAFPTFVVRDDPVARLRTGDADRAAGRLRNWCVAAGAAWGLVGLGGLIGVARVMLDEDFPPVERWEFRHGMLAVTGGMHLALLLAALGAFGRRTWALWLGVAVLAFRFGDLLLGGRANPLTLMFFFLLALLGLMALQRASQANAAAELASLGDDDPPEPRLGETEAAARPDDGNPYRAPATAAGRLVDSPDEERSRRRLRTEMTLLGGYWVLLSCLVAFVAYVLGTPQIKAPIPADLRTILFAIASVTAVVWFVLSVFTIRGNLWAVYAGVALSYLTILTNLSSGNVCTVGSLGLGIAFGHRVIYLARRERTG